MKDLTQGSIPRHILVMAIPIGISMLIQTLYYLVDLYFVGHLGPASLAGVSAAGNVSFLVIALTQVLGVGTQTLIAHAVGRKDRDDANWVFNQSLLLSALLGLITLAAGYGLSGWYLHTVSSDPATIREGLTYLYWYTPAMAGQFALIAMGSALRGTGIVMPTMVIQLITTVLNMVLSPMLIQGWWFAAPMGVAGAGLASTISVWVAVILLAWYFSRMEKYVEYAASKVRPRLSVWRRMLGIGLPAGGEFMLMFLYMAVIYFAISELGAVAQAGFGLGSRIMQSMFLPAMAVAFAAPAVAGQNFGARLFDRVRATFHWAAGMSLGIMALLTWVAYAQPMWLVQSFADDAQALVVASTFLHMICLNFMASGLIFTCSGMFQALGHTWPAMWSTATRLVTFAIPAIWLSRQADFRIEQLWVASVITVYLQLVVSWWLLQRQFRRSLSPDAAAV
ncbi:MATE family efflux transporter [Marinicella meishanensis]|uniref:MATE family efflux transporter n=1 Tax=Marinicella meishanensis TaxID=2873263 RepID=UPI001CBB56FE|nr:MATE family efflux transporter [Marinicella sp. NBU2979]